MSFLKGLGSFIGEVTGGVVGGAVNIVGEITGSELIEDIGDGIKRASAFAGDKIGEAASGTWDVAAGLITQDEYQLKEGFSDLGQAAGDTVKAAGNTVINVVSSGANVVEGLVDGDSDQVKDGLKELAKVGAIGALSFGIIDVVDGADATDAPNEVAMTSAEDAAYVENPNSHHVEPHFRTLPSGDVIWVDGDGDTSTDTYEGWEQTNPDYHAKA